jgi:hypothetical protein
MIRLYYYIYKQDALAAVVSSSALAAGNADVIYRYEFYRHRKHILYYISFGVY